MTAWSSRTGRSTYTNRLDQNARLYVQRTQGAVKHRSPLPWEWHVYKEDKFFATARVERHGRSATEEEAQRAADAALPSVLIAYEALGVPHVGGH